MGLLSLVAKLGINTTGYSAGLTRARQMTDSWGRGVASSIKGHLLAAVGTAAIAATIGRTVQKASKIQDMADTFAISTDAVQELDFALRQSGGSIEDVARALRQLNMARREAVVQPTGNKMKSFEALGISIEDIKSQDLEGLLKKVASGFTGAADQQSALSAGMDLLGRNSSAMMLAMVDGLDAARQASHDLNQVMSKETVDALDAVADAFETLKGKFTTFVAEASAKILKLAQLTKRATISSMTELGFNLEGIIASMGAYAGAKVGGASEEEAGKEARDTFAAIKSEKDAEQERLQKLFMQQDADQFQRIEKRRQVREQVEKTKERMEGFDPAEKTKKTVREKELERGALAKVGGFTGFAARTQDPLVGLSQKQLAEQVQIRRNTTPRTRDTANFTQ